MKAPQSMKRAIAIGIVGAMAICETVPASAAPVLSSTALVKIAAPNMLDQVRVRRAIGAGAALGVLGALAGVAASKPLLLQFRLLQFRVLRFRLLWTGAITAATVAPVTMGRLAPTLIRMAITTATIEAVRSLPARHSVRSVRSSALPPATPALIGGERYQYHDAQRPW